MFREWVRSGLILAALGLSAMGCASPQSTPLPIATAVTPPTSAPATAPTTIPSPANTTAGATPNASNSSSSLITLTVVPEKSKAGYRVREQLAGVSLPSDAVGSTNAITGTIVGTADGTHVSITSSQSKFVVDLRTLKSDQSLRDNFIQNTPLQTRQYPYATFVPTSATGLPTSMPPSREGSFKLIGELTIRNVTKSVTWDVTCQVQNNDTEATCHATTSFTFGFFNLTQPQVARVLSIEDNITLELDVYFRRVGN